MAAGQGQGTTFSMRMVIYGIKKAFPSVKNVTCEQLEQWRSEKQQNLLCLDTRAAEEYGVSRLLGAVHVDPSSQQAVDSVEIAPNSTVVCYCSVGYRSSEVVEKLRQAKKRQNLQLYNLEGGLFQWVCEGREIVDSLGEKATLVHPYSSFWGKLLPHKHRACL